MQYIFTTQNEEVIALIKHFMHVTLKEFLSTGKCHIEKFEEPKSEAEFEEPLNTVSFERPRLDEKANNEEVENLPQSLVEKEIETLVELEEEKKADIGKEDLVSNEIKMRNRLSTTEIANHDLKSKRRSNQLESNDRGKSISKAESGATTPLPQTTEPSLKEEEKSDVKNPSGLDNQLKYFVGPTSTISEKRKESRRERLERCKREIEEEGEEIYAIDGWQTRKPKSPKKRREEKKEMIAEVMGVFEYRFPDDRDQENEARKESSSVRDEAGAEAEAEAGAEAGAEARAEARAEAGASAEAEAGAESGAQSGAETQVQTEAVTTKPQESSQISIPANEGSLIYFNRYFGSTATTTTTTINGQLSTRVWKP